MSIDWGHEPDFAAFRRASATVQTDRSKGLRELEDLASKGSPMSMYVIGDVYRKGGDAGDNFAKAEYWYGLAADAGNVRAAYALGWMLKARGDVEGAFPLIVRCATESYAPAMNSLALMYIDGIGVERDVKVAQHWWEKAIATGNIDARTTYGMHLFRGIFGLRKCLRGLIMVSWALIEVSLIARKDKFDLRLH